MPACLLQDICTKSPRATPDGGRRRRVMSHAPAPPRSSSSSVSSSSPSAPATVLPGSCLVLTYHRRCRYSTRSPTAVGHHPRYGVSLNRLFLSWVRSPARHKLARLEVLCAAGDDRASPPESEDACCSRQRGPGQTLPLRYMPDCCPLPPPCKPPARISQEWSDIDPTKETKMTARHIILTNHKCVSPSRLFVSCPLRFSSDSRHSSPHPRRGRSLRSYKPAGKPRCLRKETKRVEEGWFGSAKRRARNLVGATPSDYATEEVEVPAEWCHGMQVELEITITPGTSPSFFARDFSTTTTIPIDLKMKVLPCHRTPCPISI